MLHDTVSCPAAGAGLPSNVVSINVEEPRNQRLRPIRHNSLCRGCNEFVYTVNTTNTQPTDTYQWAINRVAVTIANGYAQTETGQLIR